MPPKIPEDTEKSPQPYQSVPQYIGITETPEFQGWDSGEMSDTAMIFEFQHAWKDFHNKHSCPVKPNVEVLQSSKKFCLERGLPFRWYLRLCIQILGRFPKPWEINYHWLQAEIHDVWLDLKYTKVPLEIDHTFEAKAILKSFEEA